MARVKVNILGISKLKWTGIGEFNSDEHHIYDCGRESLRRNKVAIIVNKRVWNTVFGCNLKNDRMISVRFQGKPFNITVIQVYALTSNAEEAKYEWFCEDLQDLLELTPKKDILFITGDWNAEVGSQETPGVTGKFGCGVWNEAGQSLIEFCQENTQSEQTPSSNNTREDFTHRCSTPKLDWLYSLQLKMEKLCTVSKNKTRSWLWLKSWTPYCQIQT